MIPRFIPLSAFLFLLVALPSACSAQLSTRENAANVYSSHTGGSVPDPMATWLESDVDVPPGFPGGEAALTAHFCAANEWATVPVDASCGNNAEVLVWFIVEQDGSVKEAWIDRGGCPEYKERARFRALHMSQWTAGRRDDQPVRTRVRIPVRYGAQ